MAGVRTTPARPLQPLLRCSRLPPTRPVASDHRRCSYRPAPALPLARAGECRFARHAALSCGRNALLLPDQRDTRGGALDAGLCRARTSTQQASAEASVKLTTSVPEAHQSALLPQPKECGSGLAGLPGGVGLGAPRFTSAPSGLPCRSGEGPASGCHPSREGTFARTVTDGIAATVPFRSPRRPEDTKTRCEPLIAAGLARYGHLHPRGLRGATAVALRLAKPTSSGRSGGRMDARGPETEATGTPQPQSVSLSVLWVEEHVRRVPRGHHRSPGKDREQASRAADAGPATAWRTRAPKRSAIDYPDRGESRELSAQIGRRGAMRMHH